MTLYSSLLPLLLVACTTTDKPPYDDTASTTDSAPATDSAQTWDTEDTGEACTELDCDNNGYATFGLYDRYDDWQDEQDAEYTFTLTWDAGAASCTSVVSGTPSCDSELISLERSGNGMGDDIWYAVEAVLLTEFPGATVLTIEREGVLVREQSFTVEASVWYPNGEECPPECVSWYSEVDNW